jgi:GT2 family glycosyltransferase
MDKSKNTRTKDRSRNDFVSATWLTESTLLLVGKVGASEAAPHVAATLLTKLGSQQIVAREFQSRQRPNTPRLIVVIVSAAALNGPDGGILKLRWGRSSVPLTAQTIERLAVAPDVAARESLASLDARAREEIVSFAASTLTDTPVTERAGMSDRLYELRQALRERLPELVNSPDRPLGAYVDRLMAIDDNSFFVEGWLRSGDIGIVRFTAVSPEGSRVQLLDRLTRARRPDVAAFYGVLGGKPEGGLGFACFFEIEGGCSLHRHGWVFEVEDRRGSAWEFPAHAVLDDPVAVRHAILSGSHLERLPDEQLMRRHIHPAITRIQKRFSASPVVESVRDFGDPPESPDVSVVVPLYMQIDHVEAQLAEFANDREFLATDLVYVLDSPEQSEELIQRAADLHSIYRIPFRVAVLKENVGFARACNAGSNLGHGRLLLLLNSDVLPDRPGWLSTMREFYDATPNIGALGPKLLYEDDSIQHAGMYYYRLPDSLLWVDAHFYKGMHRSLPQANVARRVPLVSGACLMVSRELFKHAGGLPTMYVQGDYEDAHFCLNLLDEGFDNWYLPEAELYHLEGQSYAAESRRPSNFYNMWLHNHLISDQIQRRMSGLPPSSEGAVTALPLSGTARTL